MYNTPKKPEINIKRKSLIRVFRSFPIHIHFLFTLFLFSVLTFFLVKGLQRTLEINAVSDDIKYSISWSENPLLNINMYWNSEQRGSCSYETNPWPQTNLAAERAYVLAARQVLVKEWRIHELISQKGRSGNAWISEAETNCPKGHVDYPPHVHIAYMNDWTRLTNSHFYPDASGKISRYFVQPYKSSSCNQHNGNPWQPNAGEWVDIYDETCSAIWQQRFTSTGDLEMRINSNAPIYVLRIKSLQGDQAAVDVLVGGQVLHSVDIFQYDPVNFSMKANISDFIAKNKVTEEWVGKMNSSLTSTMLESHQITNDSPIPSTPSPTSVPTMVAPPPTSIPSIAPTPSSQLKTVNIPINNKMDDVYQSNNILYTTDKKFWVGILSSAIERSYTGLRFASVPVPKGATISKAYLKLYSPNASNSNASAVVGVELAAQSQAFSGLSKPSSRIVSNEKYSYYWKTAWPAKTWIDVPVTQPLQELISSSLWQANNPVSVIFKGVGEIFQYRILGSYESGFAPQLIIEYYSFGSILPTPTRVPTPLPTPLPTAIAANAVYVSPSGSDTNSGSVNSPWKTVGKAAQTAKAGQTVFIRQGTYYETVSVANSGTADNYITFSAYPNETVIIDGSNKDVYAQRYGVFTISGKSYIRVTGITVRNSNWAGIMATNNASYIKIDHNSTNNTDTSGIQAQYSNHIYIDSNEIQNACLKGQHENLSLIGVDYFEVSNNYIHNNEFKEKLDIKSGSSHGKVFGNKVYGFVDSAGKPHRTGIYLDSYNQDQEDIDVYNNTITNTSYGIVLACERCSNITSQYLNNVRIYNNIVYGNAYGGILVSNWDSGYVHNMSNIYIYNNTVVNNKYTPEGIGNGINIANPYARNVYVRNNIVSQNLKSQILVNSSATNVVVDNNLVFGPGSFSGINAINKDPLFVDNQKDFHLKLSSPAINSASQVQVPSFDYDLTQRPQGTGYDLGALEYK